MFVNCLLANSFKHGVSLDVFHVKHSKAGELSSARSAVMKRGEYVKTVARFKQVMRFSVF